MARLEASMRQVISLLALALVLCTPSAAQEDVEHVVLISIDGLRPDFYVDTRWPAPTLQRLAREGAHAQAVRGVFPTVTYPSHTTLITGALPGRHGIISNTPFEQGGQTGRWFWEYDAIRVPTLFSVLRDAGKETAAVSWPVTVGAPITRNFFPEIWSLQRGTPPLAATKKATTPGLVEEIESAATGKLDGRRWSMKFIGRDTLAGQAAAHLLERHRPTLLAVHFVGVDHFQHEQGREGSLVDRSLATCDSAVTLLVEAAERAGIADKTAFIITGDHGFVDIHSSLAPNVWLAEAGLLEPQRDRGDWRAAFHSGVASAFLYLRDPNDTEAEKMVREIVENRPPAERRLYRVLGREDLAEIGGDPNAALALAFVPGISMSTRADGAALRPAGGGTHGFYPDFKEIETGFIGWGSGFGAGVIVPEMGLEDIAPTVARLLGIPFEAPDGVVYPGLFARPRR